MRRISVLFLAVLFGGTALCAAQQQQSKLEIFGGYSFARVFGYPNLFNLNENSQQSLDTYDEYSAFYLKGGQASVTYFPVKHFGLTGDFADFTKSQGITGSTITEAINEQDYLFGPTFRDSLKAGRPQITLFAHQLFGVAHTSTTFTPSSFSCSVSSSGSTNPTCTANLFTMVSGGGVDLRITSHISIRPAQLDYFEQQISAESFFGTAISNDSAKLGINGFRYSAGAVINFR
jgi:hypothetical protein